MRSARRRACPAADMAAARAYAVRRDAVRCDNIMGLVALVAAARVCSSSRISAAPGSDVTTSHSRCSGATHVTSLHERVTRAAGGRVDAVPCQIQVG